MGRLAIYLRAVGIEPIAPRGAMNAVLPESGGIELGVSQR
jgi:hypothetical protein